MKTEYIIVSFMEDGSGLHIEVCGIIALRRWLLKLGADEFRKIITRIEDASWHRSEIINVDTFENSKAIVGKWSPSTGVMPTPRVTGKHNEIYGLQAKGWNFLSQYRAISEVMPDEIDNYVPDAEQLKINLALETMSPHQYYPDQSNYAKMTNKRSTEFEWNDEEYEVFRFLASQFDVRKAKTLIKAAPRNVFEINVADLATFLSPQPSEGDDKVFCINAIAIDEDRVMDVDCDYPVIYAIMITDDGKWSGIPIDGWHRLHKAYRTGRETVPCVFLEPEETEWVKIQ